MHPFDFQNSMRKIRDAFPDLPEVQEEMMICAMVGLLNDLGYAEGIEIYNQVHREVLLSKN